MAQQVERLVGYLFDGTADDMLAAELAGWLERSARLRAFVETHRDKVRKKLRGAPDEEARRDVRAELLVAARLLADRRIELAFEAYGVGKPGPDFTVTFRGAPAFNLEVTRLRRPPEGPNALTGLLLAKLRQLPTGAANALLVVVPGTSAEALDAAGAARALRARADAKDDGYFAERGLTNARGFYDRYLQLGGVLGFSEEAVGEARAALWLNGSARRALPEAAARACLICLRANPLE